MAPNRTKFFSLSSSQSAELSSFLSRGDGFFTIGSEDIPTVIPSGLRSKWDSASVIISGSESSNGAMAVVGHRIDAKVGKMDQDPFAIVVSASVPQGDGVVVHHASFESRSLDLPSEFSSALGSSGLTDYFRRNPPFGTGSGSISEVPRPLIDALDLAKSFLPTSDRSAS